MPLDYASLLATATSTIEMMGRGAVLRTFDGAEMAVTVLMTNQGAAERDGSLISRAEQQAIIAAKPGVLPDPERHRLLIDGKTYRIVSSRPLQPSTTALYFVCELRLSS